MDQTFVVQSRALIMLQLKIDSKYASLVEYQKHHANSFSSIVETMQKIECAEKQSELENLLAQQSLWTSLIDKVHNEIADLSTSAFFSSLFFRWFPSFAHADFYYIIGPFSFLSVFSSFVFFIYY